MPEYATFSTKPAAAVATPPATATSNAGAMNSWAAGVMMNGTFITQTQAQFNQTVTLINNLLLSKVQSVRSMHVALAAFSLGLGLMMIVRILSDARRAAALQVPLRPKRFSLFTNVHPAETFPLALSTAVVIQELIFVAVQSTALNSVLVTGCGGIAQIIFPAIFIVGYTTLVFGIETMVRSLRSRRFKSRGKWNTPICIIAVAAGLLFTWIPTAVWKTPNRCFGSLIWFPANFHLIAIAIMSFLLFMFLLIFAVITLRLMRTHQLDHDERVSASRICYYLVVASVLYSFILPFFIQAYIRNFDMGFTSSRLAEVALVSGGIFIAFIHLFLRVNASRMVIQPRGQKESEKRPRIRFFGPSDLQLTISGPMMQQDNSRDDVRLIPEKQPFPDSNKFYPMPEKSSYDGSRTKSGPLDLTKWPLPPNPLSPLTSPPTTTTGVHKRNRSNYSLFPTRAEDVPRLPPTIYSPPGSKAQKQDDDRRITQASEAPSVTDIRDAYLPPPSAPFAGKHRRDSSSGTSATVQIGLRLSVAPAAIAAGNASAVNRIIGQRSPPPVPPPLPIPPALRRDQSDSSGESLGLPIQKFPSNSSTSSNATKPQEPLRPVEMPKPLEIKAKQSGPASPPRSPPRSGLPAGPKASSPSYDPSMYLQNARNKVLPPAPSRAEPRPAQQQTPISGLRMNPVTPPKSSSGVGIGEGTMTRSPPPNGRPAPGWI